MQQSSYHRTGDAPGLDRNPIPPDEDKVPSHEMLTGIALGACIALAGISFVAVVFDVLISQPTQTACLLMER